MDWSSPPGSDPPRIGHSYSGQEISGSARVQNGDTYYNNDVRHSYARTRSTVFRNWFTIKKLNTELLDAAKKGQLARLQRLLQTGAELDCYGKGTGQLFTALHHATVSGHLSIVQELLKAGADPDKRSKETDLSPLMMAAREGQLDIVAELVRHGATIDSPHWYDEDYPQTKSPLLYAADKGHLDVVVCLVKYGADINRTARDHDGETALNAAVCGGHVQLVEYFLQHDADVNALGTYDTPLHKAMNNGDAATVDYLTKQRAKHTISSHLAAKRPFSALDSAYLYQSYYSALESGQRQSYESIITLLEAKGAKFICYKEGLAHLTRMMHEVDDERTENGGAKFRLPLHGDFARSVWH